MARKSKVEPMVKKEKIEGEDSETESEDENPATNGAPPQGRIVDMDVFQKVVPPPFEVPGAAYDGRRPWYFKEDT